jgi:hypothetical protein
MTGAAFSQICRRALRQAAGHWLAGRSADARAGAVKENERYDRPERKPWPVSTSERLKEQRRAAAARYDAKCREELRRLPNVLTATDPRPRRGA